MNNILITGDLLPTDRNKELFEKGDVKALVGEKLVELFRQSRFRIINLEGPLTDKQGGILKSGPNLKAAPKTINAVRALHIDLCSLANNHIMDYGEEGLHSTCQILENANIGYTGIGNNIHAAKKPYVFKIGSVQVGLYSCAEYEYTIATDHMAGANCFDALYTPDEIHALKTKVDYLIVLYHGGKECYRYPAPYVQKRCRKMVEKGADLVICQHSHCIGCMEKYLDATIVYGQGNFIMDIGDNEFVNTGLLISANPFNRDVSFYPVVKDKGVVRLGEGEIGKTILRDFGMRSEKIKQEDFVNKTYKEFAETMIASYQCQSMGTIGAFLGKLNFTKGMDLNYGTWMKLTMLNILRCEAHNDLYCEGLLGEIYGKQKYRRLRGKRK